MPKSNRKRKSIYLDYASSASPNPSSIHSEGVFRAKQLEKARSEIASVLSCRKEEVIFTSGGTESNNLAIWGTIWKALELFSYSFTKDSLLELQKNISNTKIEKRVETTKTLLKNATEKSFSLPHIITTNIEHPSVLETFRLIAKRKLGEVSIIRVEENGIVDPKKIKKEIKENTVLISVSYANNEIGTIQPIKEIAKEIRHFRKWNGEKSVGGTRNAFPYFHIDAVQAVNYLSLNVEQLGVDMLSLSGIKVKKGGRVGVLYKRKNVEIANVFGGGNQEFGLRPGTENVDEILKFSKSFLKVQTEREKESKRLAILQEYFFKKIRKAVPNALINGDTKERLPNNVNITIPRIPSDLMVIELSAKGVMISEKSACKSGDKKASYVIEAIRKAGDKKLQGEDYSGSLRFSFGEDTTKKEIDYALKSLSLILQKLKKWYR